MDLFNKIADASSTVPHIGSSSSFKDISPDEIAALHYQCINHIINNYRKDYDKPMSCENLVALTDLMSGYLLQMFPDMAFSVLNTKEKLVTRLRKYGNDENQKSLFFMLMFSVDKFQKEIERTNLCIQLKTDLCIFLKMSLDKDQVHNADHQLNSILNSNYGQLDDYCVSCIKAVGQSGVRFWGNYGFISKASGKCPPEGFTCDEWVIVCDALGSAIGSALGTFGIIFTGALFSMAAARECEDCNQSSN